MRPPAWSEAPARSERMPRLRLRLLPREIPLKTAPYLSSRVASLRGKETSLLVRLRDGWTCSKSHFLLVFSIPFSTLALRRSTRCRWLRQLPCFCAKESTATRLGTSTKGGDGPDDAHQIARCRSRHAYLTPPHVQASQETIEPCRKAQPHFSQRVGIWQGFLPETAI